MPQQFPPVSPLISQAFIIAMAKYNEELTRMTNLSARLSMRGLVPLAVMDIQRMSQLDCVLLSLEDERAAKMAGLAPEGNIIDFNYEKMFAELWVGGWYEILRAVRQRAGEAAARGDKTSGVEYADEFKSLLADFEQLRMPLEKYEIAKDKGLKEPLVFKRYPPNDDDTDNYIYDKEDPQRNHRMPSGLSARGSVMWLAMNPTSHEEHWIERRGLSERLLRLADHPTMK
jgi:hypothetical protein